MMQIPNVRKKQWAVILNRVRQFQEEMIRTFTESRLKIENYSKNNLYFN